MRRLRRGVTDAVAATPADRAGRHGAETDAMLPGTGDDGSLSLVNIAFLLLAFFVMAGAIRASDPFPVSPPAGTAPPLAESAVPELLVAADGRMALDGTPVGDAAGTDLEAALAALPAPPSVLRLRVDGDADAGRLMRLLDRLRTAGLGEVVLVTRTAAPDDGR